MKRSYPIEAGVLVRGQIKREVQKYCLHQGIRVSRIEETKGLLESLYVFHLEGEQFQLDRFERDVQRWMAENHG